MKNKTPIELLEFFKSLSTIDKMNLKLIDFKTFVNDDINFNIIECSLNNVLVIIHINIDMVEEAGSFYFIEDSQKAKFVSIKILFDKIMDYYNLVYKNWVYNDTGYKISDKFTKEIEEEINRIKITNKLI